MTPDGLSRAAPPDVVFLGSVFCFTLGAAINYPPAAAVALVAGIAAITLRVRGHQGAPVIYAFAASFLVFALSHPILMFMFGYHPGRDDGESLLLTTVSWPILTSLALAVAGIYAAMVVMPERIRRPIASEITADQLQMLRHAALTIFVATWPVLMYTHWVNAQQVSTHGYLALYTGATGVAGASSWLFSIGSVSRIAFLGYLAALPARRQFVVPALMYIADGAFKLAAGARADAVLNTVILIMYMGLRNRSEPGWWPRRLSVILTATALPTLALLGWLQDWRVDRHASLSSLDPREALYAQGSSLNVVGHAIELSDRIDRSHYFSLGPLRDVFANRLPALFGGGTDLGGQTVERALDSGWFANYITYLLYPTEYLRGYGLGSSFVAELWVDGGPLLVLVGSTLVGLALLYLGRATFHPSWLIRCLALIVLRDAMLLPRASVTEFVITLTLLPTIVTVGLLTTVYLISAKRSTGGPERCSVRSSATMNRGT